MRLWSKMWSGVEWMGDTPWTVMTTRAPAVLKSIVQFVVKTGVVCALIHDRKKFHGRGTLLLLVKNDAELLKMKTTCTSDK